MEKMFNKKIMLITIILIGLFAVSVVSAAENVSEETGTADEILTSEDSEIQSIENNEEKLEDNEGTFNDLDDAINGNSDPVVNLNRNYTYTEGDPMLGIIINRNDVTINGNGHTIDAQGKARIFYVDSVNVTIKNITFKNGYTEYTSGGAIYWYGANGQVIGCTFNNNHADQSGGAIYWYGADGWVTDCTFNNNHANDGGAIYWHGSNGWVTDCTFNNNHADPVGGAILWGSSANNGRVTDCTFNNNHADSYGGAIYSIKYLGVTADSCIFKTSSDTTDSVNVLPPVLRVDDLTTGYNSGEKITFNLTTNDGNTVINNANITIDIYKNNESFKTYYCLSGEDWLVDLPVGSYDVSYKTEFAEFKPVNRTITIQGFNPNLSVDSAEATYPENVTLTLNYNSTATGKVNITLKGKKQNYTFRDIDLNSTTLLGKINSDEYNVTVTYSGDEGFLNATATTTLKVNRGQFKIDANITGAAEGDVKTDQNATVTIDITNIPADATGEIIINITGINKNYTITLPVTVNTVQLDIITTPGTYTLNAQYKGNDNCNPSNLVKKTFTVSNWNETDLQDLIDNSTGNVTLEHNYTFTNPNATVNVTNATTINGNGHTIDANGSATAINITADNTTVANMTVNNVNGTAIQMDTNNSTVTNITATNTTGTLINVTGDNNTISNINATGNATINVDGKNNKMENITGATVIPSIKATNVVKGNDVIITATVSATEGNVTVTFDGKKYAVPLDDGKAVITIPNVKSGTYSNIPVTYEGTDVYQSVSTNTSFTSKVEMTGNKDASIDYLSGYKYTVCIKNAEGKYAAGMTVKMTVNGVTYNVKTDKNGYAKLPITLKPKTYKITVQYLNVKKTNKITVKSTIFLVKKTVTVKKTAKKFVLQAKLKWSSGKAIKGKVIKFKFKGKTYKAKTNSKGIAKVTVKKTVIKKLKKGKTYKFWAKYTNEYKYGKVIVKK